MKRSLYINMVDEKWLTSLRTWPEKLMALAHYAHTAPPATPEDRNPLHIIVAPEYTFRRSPAAVIRKLKETFFKGEHKLEAGSLATAKRAFRARYSDTAFTADDKDELIRAMCALSVGRNMLIVPGTIFWVERAPVMRPGSGRKKVALMGIIRNTCPVIYRGNLVHTYHKQRDAHELDYYEEGRYQYKGGINGGTFEVGGLSCGVEVCMDHAGTALRTEVVSAANPKMTAEQVFLHNKLSAVETNGGGPPTSREVGLDIHILISDGMMFDQSGQAIRKGGVAVHCDTNAKNVYVRSPVNNQIFPQPAIGDGRTWMVTLETTVASQGAFASAKRALEQNLKFKTA